MNTAVRFLMAADLKDLNIWLARYFARGPFKRTSGGEGYHPHSVEAK